MEIKISDVVVNNRKRKVGNIDALKDSISKLGLLNPITVTKENVLVAGMHRLAACKELGFDTIKCQVIDLDDLHAELAEIDENIVRSQLTELEESIQLARRKEIYEALHPEVRHGGDRGNQHTGPKVARRNNCVLPKKFAEDSAEKVGLKERTIQLKVQIGATLKQIADKISGTHIEDSQKDLLELARIANSEGIDAASEVIDIVNTQQNGNAGGTKMTDGKNTVKNALRQYKRKKQAEQASIIEVQNDMIDFRIGDFVDILSDIPDGTIDLIITDPPYPYEYIEQWSALSAFASRVLKPGGFCIAYSGHMHLPEVMQRMSDCLDYYWTFALMQSGYAQFLTPRNMYVVWKPILVFQNGFSLYKPDKDPMCDVIDGSGKAKFSHVWQQGEDELDGIIEHFSDVGDIICDPFAGSGTTLIKAVKMKRRAIGCEIDETHFGNAKKRISDALQ